MAVNATSKLLSLSAVNIKGAAVNINDSQQSQGVTIMRTYVDKILPVFSHA